MGRIAPQPVRRPRIVPVSPAVISCVYGVTGSIATGLPGKIEMDIFHKAIRIELGLIHRETSGKMSGVEIVAQTGTGIVSIVALRKDAENLMFALHEALK